MLVMIVFESVYLGKHEPIVAPSLEILVDGMAMLLVIDHHICPKAKVTESVDTIFINARFGNVLPPSTSMRPIRFKIIVVVFPVVPCR